MDLCCIVDKRFREHNDGTISLDPLCRATLRQANATYGEYLDFTLGRLGGMKSVISLGGALVVWAPGWDFFASQAQTYDEWLVNATLKTGLVPDFERCMLMSSGMVSGPEYRTLVEKDLRTGEITYEIPEFESYLDRIDEAEQHYARLK